MKLSSIPVFSARAGALLALLCALSACAGLANPAPEDRFALMLEGTYAEGPQTVASARGVYTRIRRADMPAFGRHVLYVELRQNDAAGKVSRQRLYVLGRDADGGLILTPYTFKAPALAEGAADDPAKLKGLTPDAVEPLGPGCVFAVRDWQDGFEGVIDPKLCQVKSRRGTIIQVRSIMRISATELSQSEQGFDASGKVLFGEQESEPYRWPRQGPPVR